MAELYFKIGADIDKVVELSNAIKNTEQQLKSLGSNATPEAVEMLEARLAKLRTEFRQVSGSVAVYGDDLERAKATLDKFCQGVNLDGLNTNTVDGQLEALQATIKSTQEETDKLTEQMGEYQKAAAEAMASGNAEQFEQLSQKISETENAIRNNNGAISEMQAAMTTLEQATGKTLTVISEMDAKEKENETTLTKWLGGQKNVDEILRNLPQPIQNVVSGIGGMTKAALAFIATPLGAVIAAITLALKTVYTWFNSSAEGQRAMASASGYLSGILGQLKEVIVQVGKFLYNTFSDPVESVKSLGTAIYDHVMSRIEALKSMINNVGEAISYVFEGEWEKAAQSAANAMTDLGKASGVTQLVNGINKANQAVVDFRDNMVDAANKSAELAVRENDLEVARVKWKTEEEKLNTEIAKQRLKIYNTSLSDNERLEAVNKATEAINKKYQKQIEFAKEERDIIKERNELTTNANEDNAALDAAEAEVERLEAMRNNELAALARRTGSLGTASAKSQKEYTDKLLELEKEAQASELEMMQEGTDKKIAQINLEYAERIKTIKAKQEEIAKLNKENGVTDVNDNGLTETQQGQIDTLSTAAQTAQAKAIDEVNKEERSKRNEYLAEYGNYYAKRLAIAEEYNRKIAEANENGDTWGAKSLDREKGDALANLEIEELKKDPAYAKAFSEVDKVGTQTLENLKAKLEELAPKMRETMSEDSLKEFQDMLKGISDELTERDPFAAIADSLKRMSEAKKEYKRAINELKAANQRLADAEANLDYNDPDTLEEYSNALDDVAAAQKDVTDAQNDASEASEDLDESYDQARAAIGKFVSSLGTLNEALGGSLDDVMTIANSTLTAMDNIETLVNVSINGMKEASTAGARAIQAVETASVILAIISAVIQAVQALVSVFSKEDDTYEKLQEQYEDLCDVWDTLIDKKREYIAIEYGDEAKTEAENVQSLLQQETEAASRLAKERLRDRSRNAHSVGYRMNNETYSDEDWAQLAATEQALGITTSSVREVSNLADLTADQLSYIRENNSYFWSKLDDDFKSYLEDIIEYGETSAEVVDELNEALTGMSFDDFYSEYEDLITDMDATSEDFADNFEENLRNAILQSLLANTYKDRIQSLYDSWVDTMSDSSLSDSAREQALADLKEQNEALTEEIIAARDSYSEMLGLNSGYDDDTTATSGAFETMSEDTATELNGRFTALQISGEQILLQSQQQTETLLTVSNSLANLYSVSQGIANYTAENNRILANSYLELKSISENTANALTPLTAMNSNIEEMYRYIKNNL